MPTNMVKNGLCSTRPPPPRTKYTNTMDLGGCGRSWRQETLRKLSKVDRKDEDEPPLGNWFGPFWRQPPATSSFPRVLVGAGLSFLDALVIQSTPVHVLWELGWARFWRQHRLADKKFPQGGSNSSGRRPPIPRHTFWFLIKMIVPEASRWICLGRSTWRGLLQWSSSTCSFLG